jgi:hypothetical protein
MFSTFIIEIYIIYVDIPAFSHTYSMLFTGKYLPGVKINKQINVLSS